LAGCWPTNARGSSRGNSFAIFASLQGEPIQQLGPPVELPFDAPFCAGIAFCSHLAVQSDAAVFSNVVLVNAAGKVRCLNPDRPSGLPLDCGIRCKG